jgi:hypothetical protein
MVVGGDLSAIYRAAIALESRSVSDEARRSALVHDIDSVRVLWHVLDPGLAADLWVGTDAWSVAPTPRSGELAP